MNRPLRGPIFSEYIIKSYQQLRLGRLSVRTDHGAVGTAPGGLTGIGHRLGVAF
jgi:hypothetical protein